MPNSTSRHTTGERHKPYDSADLGKEGDRRPVTRGLQQGFSHPVVGQMAYKEMGRGASVRQGFRDSDLDSN